MIKANRTSALVSFIHARTPEGQRYANERLPLAALRRRAPSPSLRGGCRRNMCVEHEAPLNAHGYPQLVQSNRCALCKRTLDIMQAPSHNWMSRHAPTCIATPERLQCERCRRVRYCSAWCAHIHYWACHRYLCPLPKFSTDHNAEYVVRNGTTVFAVPVRCLDTSLLGNGTLSTKRALQARVHAWTSLAHVGTRLKPMSCPWCTAPITPNEKPTRHDVWFVALITRIRHAKQARWDVEPKWNTPLTIYASIPLKPDDPLKNWPAVHPLARFPTNSASCNPCAGAKDTEMPAGDEQQQQ